SGAGRVGRAAGAAEEPDPPLEELRRDVEGGIAARRRGLRGGIDGRLSLAETAARVQEVDLASKSFRWQQFRRLTPGATDEERQCRMVIAHATGLLADDPDRARAVTRRLEAELPG